MNNPVPFLSAMNAGLTLLLVFASAVGTRAENAIAAAHTFPGSDHLVMTWVPPYAVTKARARLDESFDGVGMADSLTHLGLQFWASTRDGGIERVRKYGAIPDTAINELCRWGRAHGVRVLLCIFNGVDKWDWSLARAGFAEHPQRFADALLAEVERLDLDGVDLDLEGNGEFNADKDAYVTIVRDLSTRLHAKGKHLTVDSFADRWNVPNQSWWKELLPIVDGLSSMGYDETGAFSESWRAYSRQIAAAGPHAARLLLGLPADKAAWQGHPAREHLSWVEKDGGCGVALWDAQLEAAAWRTREVWLSLQRISGRK